MRGSFLVEIFGAMVAISSTAEAKVVDFDLQTRFSGKSYAQDGIKILNYYNQSMGDGSTIDYDRSFTNWNIWTVDPQKRYNANGSNPTLASYYPDTTITFSKDDGSSFDFQGISLADSANQGIGGYVDITFNYNSGEKSTETVTLLKSRGLQDFTFSHSALKSVSFTARPNTTSAIQFDFFKFDNDLASPLPEPNTWFFLVIGFGAIGYTMRRRATNPSYFRQAV